MSFTETLHFINRHAYQSELSLGIGQKTYRNFGPLGTFSFQTWSWLLLLGFIFISQSWLGIPSMEVLKVFERRFIIRFMLCRFVFNSSPHMRYKFHWFNMINKILTLLSHYDTVQSNLKLLSQIRGSIVVYKVRVHRASMIRDSMISQ